MRNERGFSTARSAAPPPPHGADRKCPACGVKLTSERQSFCSPACRQFAYRERQKLVEPPSKRHGWRDTVTVQASRNRDTKLILDIVFELGEHARRGGTAYGSSAVVKRVAIQWGIDVSMVGLPRPTRAEREDAAWEALSGSDVPSSTGDA